MKIVRIISLVRHTAMIATAKRSLAKGQKVIAMCSRESAPEQLKALEGMTFVDSEKRGYFRQFKKEVADCDFIFFHSLAEDYTFALHMIMHPSLMKKAVWLIAGADLYSWARPVKGSFVQRAGARLRNWIAHAYRMRIPYVFCTAVDQYRYQEEFGRAVVYPQETNSPGFSAEQLDSLRPVLPDEKPLRILIGHCSYPDLHHEEVIERLKTCDLPEDTRFVFPLNYGNKDYGDRVAAAAIKAFGNNAEILREKIPFEEYAKMLWSVDCAIFLADRQIAFGNLLMLLYMEKKVFLKKNSVLWRFFAERDVPVFDAEDLDRGVFLDHSSDLTPAKEFVRRVIDPERSKEEFDRIFEDLEKRCKDTNPSYQPS